MSETVHHINAHLTRERPPIRRAHLELTGTDVTFGVPGWQGEHYGFDPSSVEEHPGTLDYLVASVAGCLIGTFGGTLTARGITSNGDALVADADGEVVVDPDGVLRLRKITVRYTLRAPEEQRAAAERCNAIHAKHCPNARSVAAAIDIVTELDFQPVDAPVGAAS
ncbi:MAG: OsmC family protein [Thermoleophilia bacterium]